MKLARKWILVAALVMSVAMATSGTLAYLTDRDSEVNVFTFGNVDIELNEEFTQGTALIPGVTVEKAATITNKGTTDAWVWYTLAIPTALDNSTNASNNVIHTNVPGRNWFGYHTNQNYWLEGQTEAVPDEKTWIVDAPVFGEGKDFIQTEINDVPCTLYAHLYKGTLAPGETTSVGLSQVYLDYHIDIDPEGNLYHVEKGEITKINWNINEDGAPAIYLAAYAIQKDGFGTVEDAFAAYNTQWGENGGVEYVSNLSAANSEELATAVAATKNGVVSITADIESNVTVPAGNDVTLNLGGNTLNGSITAQGDVTVNGGEINVDGYGVESFADAQFADLTVNAGNAAHYSVINHGDATYDDVTIMSGGGGVGVVDCAKVEFNSGKVEVDSTSTSGRYLFYLEGAGSELTINGGDFDFNKTQNQKRAYVYASADTTVYIKGGTFGKASTRSGYTAGLLGEGTIIVTGGTFGFNPSAFVPATHEAVKTGDVWVVSAK